VSGRSASLPGHFTTRDRAYSTNRTGGWVGPRDGLDAVAKRKKSLPMPGIEFLSSSLQSSHYSDWATSQYQHHDSTSDAHRKLTSSLNVESYQSSSHGAVSLNILMLLVGHGNFSSTPRPHRLWGPHSLLSGWYQALFPLG